MLISSRGTTRNDRGDNLPSLVIAMVVFALLVPGLLLLLARSQQLATAAPDWDEGIQARAELAELFGSVDPIGECASPVGGPEAAFRDTCFREQPLAGASLIQPPDESPMACWLTLQENGDRQRRCLVLEGDTALECVKPPTGGPCLEVLSEVTGEPVMVDKFGGGRLIVRSWDEEPTVDCFQREYLKRSGGVPLTADVPHVPFLPYRACFLEASVSDRLIYTDVEWACLKWRHPYDRDLNRDGDTKDPGEWAAHEWIGECPNPTDPTEPWPSTAGLPLSAKARVLLEGWKLVYSHEVGDRISGVEILVCVASDYADRLQGASHCTVDRMRFNVADRDGQAPPTPIVPAIALHPDIVANGLTILEGNSVPLPVRLLTAPSTNVVLSVTAPEGSTVSPMTLTFAPANWNTPQTVTVTAAEDDDRNDEDVTLTLTAESTDHAYHGLTASAAATITDDDKPELRATVNAVTVDETATAVFGVKLGAAPQSDVAVSVTPADASAVTASPAWLAFTPSIWATPQTIIVTGVDDADANDETTAVTLVASSDDRDYNSLEPLSIAVTVTDDDTPALVFSATEVTVDEGGTATVDVSLATQPSDSVTVTAASADPAAATVAPASLAFTSASWSTAQTFTITGTDDPNSTDETTTISVSATGSGWTSVAPVTVAVAVTDDDPVTELTVTCDTTAETIAIAWPADGADAFSVLLNGPGGLAQAWYSVEGSSIEVSTATLPGWGSFYPAGGEVEVTVHSSDTYYGTFNCP